MNQLIIKQLKGVFEMTTDLASSLSESHYLFIQIGETETIGDLLRKIVGYRESHIKQLRRGGVFDFNCTVGDGLNKLHILKALHDSQNELVDYCHSKNFNERENEICLQILEDEARIQGEMLYRVKKQGWLIS